MVGDLTGLAESLFATRERAIVGQVSAMNTHVLLQGVVRAQSFLALLALEYADSQMDQVDVPLEVILIIVGFAAGPIMASDALVHL